MCDGLGPLIHTSITFNSNRSSTSAGGNFAQSLENPTNLQPVFLSCRLPLSKLLPGLFVRKSHFCKFSAIQCNSTSYASYVHCSATHWSAFFQFIFRESLHFCKFSAKQCNSPSYIHCCAVQLTEVHFCKFSAIQCNSAGYVHCCTMQHTVTVLHFHNLSGERVRGLHQTFATRLQSFCKQIYI